MAKMTKAAQAERAEAIERLREWVKPGDQLFTILRNVSASGMSRTIQVIKIDAKGEPLFLGFNVAQALGLTFDSKREGVKVSGCGMDMGFHLVDSLGRALYPDHKGQGQTFRHRWM
jgi:hypothetical protein